MSTSISVRLSNSMRDEIRKAAITSAFENKFKAQKKLEEKLAAKCYCTIYGIKIRKWVDEAPEGWLRADNCLRVNANGWNVQLCSENFFKTPHSKYCSPLGNVTGELAEEVQKFSQDKESLSKEQQEAVQKMDSFLLRFNTLKQLKEGWPEGEKFYKCFNVNGSVALPAIVTEEINSMLGLCKP